MTVGSREEGGLRKEGDGGGLKGLAWASLLFDKCYQYLTGQITSQKLHTQSTEMGSAKSETLYNKD